MKLSLKKEDVIMENHVLMGRCSGKYKKPPKHASFNLYPPSIKGRKITHILLVDTTKREHQHLVLSAEKFLAEHGDDERVSLAFNKAAVYEATDLSVDELNFCKELAVFDTVNKMLDYVRARIGRAPEPDDEPPHGGGGGSDAAGADEPVEVGASGRAGANASDSSNPGDSIYFEGNPKLALHYRRERSGKLRQAKIDAVIAKRGKLVCELCGDEGAGYPDGCRDRLFEVHHIKPLADAAGEVSTSLDDLAVLCANCHRAVHASAEVENNYRALEQHFAARQKGNE